MVNNLPKNHETQFVIFNSHVKKTLGMCVGLYNMIIYHIYNITQLQVVHGCSSSSVATCCESGSYSSECDGLPFCSME